MIREFSEAPRVAFSAICLDMKPSEIRANLHRKGVTQSALGEAVGLSKDAMSRLMNEQRKITADEAARIDAFFRSLAVQVEPTTQKVPVFGYAAAGGEDRIAMASDHVLEEIEIPSGLTRGPVIGIRVSGDSMAPRLFSGELVIVGVGVPPARDRDCVVEFRDGTAIVKEYKGQRDGWVFLRQYNPDSEVKVNSADVKSVHAVLLRR
jgi:phage repressor protein C with HTH and peptisase S24 domain